MRATLHLPVTRRIKVVRTTEWDRAARSSSLPSASLPIGSRPLYRADRPSRSPALSSSPPGNFGFVSPPCALAISDLSSSIWLCFGSNWLCFALFEASSHRQGGLPDVIALSRLACRVRTFVGQDYGINTAFRFCR